MRSAARSLLSAHRLLACLRYAHTASPHPPPQPRPRKPSPPKTRHDPHEANLTVNTPFNPPGGGGGVQVEPITRSALGDAMLTTVIGIGLVFVGGVVYLKWYKANVLKKIELSFAKGYDPALELVQHRKPSSSELSDDDLALSENVRRKEQDLIDSIVHGKEPGHYFMILGPKGSGKGTMMFSSMSECQAEGVSMCDAHPDLEVFRLRLGKALNYEFNEDSQTGLFQRRDPREGGPALDIERALNKLEKVALRLARRNGRPLVLIINNVHFFHNDDEGRNMLLQLQQKAESWAASGILTMVFSSDDFWPFHVMRKSASRMHTLSIYDLDYNESIRALSYMHKAANKAAETEEIRETVNLVGGRLAYLSKVAKARSMLEHANLLLRVEKAWLLSRIGLIPDCDDDVMDEQKWSSCSWLLLQEFVKIRQEQEKSRAEEIEAGIPGAAEKDLPLPIVPYWKARQIMTRADFIEELDHANIISIDIHHDVRPDSMLILHAAQQVVEEEGFQEVLDGVRARIDEIESLHRTRELTFKDVDTGDMIRLSVDKGGADLAETLRRS